MGFKKDFAWGVGSSSYQIEGGAYEADKGLNIWDVGCKLPATIADGHNGDVACDHYHRYKEDVLLMKKLGIRHYRFSIDWARLIPGGVGKTSDDGVRFYNSLIDELIANGIEPWITLFHWEYPYALEQKGGWRNPESPQWFEYYASVVARLFSDRVKHYFTINEPQCFVEHGYRFGTKAPFYKLPQEETVVMAHNVLKANGLAVRALRAHAKSKIDVSFCMTCVAKIPLRPQDEDAARKEFFRYDGSLFNANWWSDPVFFGRYPEEHLREMNIGFQPSREDMETIRVELDHFGVNVYSGDTVTAGPDGKALYMPCGGNAPKTAMNWNVTPECLYYAPKFLYERYKKPIFITENGVALTEWKTETGIRDDCRADYVKRHLQNLKRAAEDGIEIGGYFYWSFTDNFEWKEGYGKRFGLVHVDYDTQERTPKDSAYWYKSVIEQNGGNL